MTRRLVTAVLLLAASVGFLAASCSAAERVTLGRAAVGRWSCLGPSGSYPRNLQVTVEGSGHFTLELAPGALGTRGARPVPPVSGRWSLNHGEVNVTLDSKGVSHDWMQVTGASLDSTRLAVAPIGLGVVAKPSQVIVHRLGIDTVTFRDAAPGAMTYSCKKG